MHGIAEQCGAGLCAASLYIKMMVSLSNCICSGKQLPATVNLYLQNWHQRGPMVCVLSAETCKHLHRQPSSKKQYKKVLHMVVSAEVDHLVHWYSALDTQSQMQVHLQCRFSCSQVSR